MPIPNEVEAKIREQGGDVSGLNCLAERDGQLSYVVYKKESPASVRVYCFNSLTQSVRNLVCPWRTVEKFQKHSDTLYFQFHQLLRLGNNDASTLMFNLIEIADSIQNSEHEPDRMLIPITTQHLTSLQLLSISLTISRLVTGANSTRFMYERIPNREWIVEYSYLGHGLESHRFFQWEKIDNNRLNISAIRGIQQSTRVYYDDNEMPNREDNVDERTAELMTFLGHDHDEDSLSETDTNVNGDIFSEADTAPATPIGANCKLPSNSNIKRPFQSLAHSLLQLDAKLQRYCEI